MASSTNWGDEVEKSEASKIKEMVLLPDSGHLIISTDTHNQKLKVKININEKICDNCGKKEQTITVSFE